jgi:alpha-glucosidase
MALALPERGRELLAEMDVAYFPDEPLREAAGHIRRLLSGEGESEDAERWAPRMAELNAVAAREAPSESALEELYWKLHLHRTEDELKTLGQNADLELSQQQELQRLEEFRTLVDSFPERMTVGELFSGDPALAPKLSASRHLVFDFELIRTQWEAEGFAEASQKHEERFGDAAWPTIVLSNHDQSRQASRLAPDADAETSDEVARAAGVLSLTMRGTPFLYYGEEIGARDVPVPWSEIIDPPAKRGGRLVRRLVPWWNRDQARSPMPWGGGGPNGGFSTARPWLRMAPDVDTRNVAAEDADRGSVLATYRKLLWLRRRHPALQIGSYRRLRGTSHDVYAYERATPGESIIVAVNFGDKDTPLRVRTGRRWTVLFDTHERPTTELVGDDHLTLAPHEAIILVAG